MKRLACWMAAAMLAVPTAADAQGRRQGACSDAACPQAMRAGSAPLPPRRPAGLKPASAEPAKAQPGAPEPERKPAEAGEPGDIGKPAPPASLSCTVGLTASHGDGVSPIDPAKLNAGLDAGCHVEEPVLLRRLTLGQGDEAETLAFDPPVTIACALAAPLARWLQIGLQPLAKGHFAQRATRLRVGGGHECRRRNRSAAGPLSEHSTGRALDIFAFVLEGEKTPERGKASDRAKGELTISVERPAGLQQIAFLEAVRQSACGAFMTVLGPGSDAAHANHLHLDVQPRRSGSSRFCQ